MSSNLLPVYNSDYKVILDLFLILTSIKDCEAACSTGDSSLATAPPDAAPPPTAEVQCVC